jgi:hypothetical protein
MRISLTFFVLLVCHTLTSQQLSWPEITRENKPWTRWWWPGSIVSPPDLTAAMETYSEAGLGGMEIAVIYGVKGYEDRFINYLSPRWMEMFTYTLKEAKRLGLGIELANASGWPFGGPWVSPEDACRNINYKTWALSSGDSLAEKIEFIQQPLVRPVGERPDITKLNYPVARNENLQLYALDQIRFQMPLPLVTLIAYSDRGEVLDLTSKVTSGGKLEWIAGDGKWTLYALFEGWHGKMAERAGPGGEGDVIDHFSGKAIRDYLEHFDEIFKDYDVTNLRGYFNDSYEVDDASGQADWTNDLFYEFYLRRGYDLRANLPALFQKDEPDKNERILSDYRLTIADLILDKFTTYWTQWAHRQGKTTRNQAHGSPGNILDLYAASDIPETEGNEITRFKFASSAANVTGKKYASCEAATWLNEHFISSLSDVKKTADLFFLGGINHVYYHGTCFTPLNVPWPGFLFYASVEFTPANPFWTDFKALNSYIARTQSFLQSGSSDNEVLLYFPVFDRYAHYGKGMLEHFDALSPAFDGTRFKEAADDMTAKGYCFDYVSDLQLTQTQFTGEYLETQGNIYKTIIIPECKYIPAETFAQVLRLASDGAIIIFYGNMPANISGWADKEEKTRYFDKLKENIRFKPSGIQGVMSAEYGRGIIVSGNDLDQLLSFSGNIREELTDIGLSFSRRKLSDGKIYFIANRNEKPFEGWVPMKTGFRSAAIFNPMSGLTGKAPSGKNKSGGTDIFLKLDPFESLIIRTYDQKIGGSEYLFFDYKIPASKLEGKWKLEFISGGPVLPDPIWLDELVSWTDLDDENLKNFSGTARYTINFIKPAGRAEFWSLDLGKVCESAKVSLNGKFLGTLIGPSYRITINSDLLKPTNVLTIDVSNLMANRIAYMDRNKINWKKFYNANMAARLKQNTVNGIFDASGWKPMSSGLLGPVTIAPAMKHRIR